MTPPGAIVVENEFARVRVEHHHVGNGQRLLIMDLRTGTSITLDPLELEGLAWAGAGDLERFVNPATMARWRDPHDRRSEGES